MDEMQIRLNQLDHAGIILHNTFVRKDGKVEAIILKHQVEWLKTYADIEACIPGIREYGTDLPVGDMYCDIRFTFKPVNDTLPDPYPGWNESFEGQNQINTPTSVEIHWANFFFSNGYEFTINEDLKIKGRFFTRNPLSPPDFAPRANFEQPMIGRPALPARHGAKWYYFLQVGNQDFNKNPTITAWGPFESEDEAMKHCNQLIISMYSNK